VAPRLDAMVTEFAERLDKWVEQAGKEVHREMLDVLGAARRERADAEPDAERASAECDALSRELGDITRRLQQLESGVWGSSVHAPAVTVEASAPASA